MLDRRRMLLAASAAAALGPGCAASTTGGASLAASPAAPLPAPAAGSGDAALNGLMERIFRDMAMSSPEALTSFGMDRGPAAPMKARLDDRSQAKVDADRVKMRGYAAEAAAIDRAALSQTSKVHYDTLRFFSDTAEIGAGFPYGGGSWPAPYLVSQLGGSYRSIPDFLDSQHSIAETADAEAYLSRLAAFATALDQETARVTAAFGAGAVPPDFVIDRTLTQMDAVLGADPAGLTLVRSVARRAEAAGIAGDWAARAEAIVRGEVLPALSRQRALFAEARPRAVHDAGCWRLPRGDEFYAYGLRFFTTTNMSADAVHDMGLEQVAQLTARADTLLRAQGLTQGTVAARIAALGRDPRFVYPNTDAAKEELLAELNVQMRAVEARMPEYFGRLPRSPVEVRRVPVDIEAGAPGGYYQGPSLDGSRPGAYYINLRDTAEWPKWSLPTLTYHEATPGHHFQIALQMENAAAPMLMRVMGFSAYSEGWGLYAEQLADEIGMYADDPFGQIGYLQSMMFRAVRLVVDTGLHHKRWSREQAIRYMVEALGDQESTVTTEVERYSVWPGQACSYKVGHAEWVRLREESRASLGARFDIKGFHDAGLGAGGVPLTVLEQVIRDWRASVG